MMGEVGAVGINRDNSKGSRRVSQGMQPHRFGYVFNAIAFQKPEGVVKRNIVLYLATFAVLVALDFLFLGVLAKGFFVSEVGDMLAEVKPVPAILFYLLYVVGILIFVSRTRSTLLYGALFG